MREATREFLRNPPPGSKTRAAMTPSQRLERMQRDQIDARPLKIVKAAPTTR
jgi:hypothetical protein